MNGDNDEYEEKDVSAFLPRNLSYAGDIGLDEYSISSSFVHTARAQKDRILYMHLLRAMAEEEASSSQYVDHGSSVDPERVPSFERQNSQTGSDTPSDDAGIYVNVMTDALETDKVNGDLRTLDEGISCSPEGSDLDASNQGRKERLEEAVQNIAAQEGVQEGVQTIAEQDVNGKPELNIVIDKAPFLQPTTEEAILNYSSSKSPLYEDNEFNFSRGELRKSSSLRTNKTPPGTPSRKKVVRFADAMGLDLESVRNIVNMDTPPKVPASALADLRIGLAEDRVSMGSKYLTACFSQPGADEDFVKKVVTQKVCLENAVITGLTITGVIRVSNISFNKMVRVRYSTNTWATFHDIAASYIQNSCDGPSDRFSFSLVAPANFDVGCNLQFAISYKANGKVYWDNNDDKNYVFECFAKTVPTEAENSWMHFL